MAVYQFMVSKKTCCCLYFVSKPKEDGALFFNGEVYDLGPIPKRILNHLLEKQGTPVKKDNLLKFWDHEVILNNVDQAIHQLHKIPGFKELIKYLPREQSYYIKNFVNMVVKKNDSFCICAICPVNPIKLPPLVKRKPKKLTPSKFPK